PAGEREERHVVEAAPPSGPQPFPATEPLPGEPTSREVLGERVMYKLERLVLLDEQQAGANQQVTDAVDQPGHHRQTAEWRFQPLDRRLDRRCSRVPELHLSDPLQARFGLIVEELPDPLG